MAGMAWPPNIAIAKSTSKVADRASEIATVRIYPPIGVCRVGSSSEWFYAPEVPGLPPAPKDGKFKDAASRIKKQAQRFRLYAFDKNNRIIGELTNRNSQIFWNVHLANTKACWYRFRHSNGDGGSESNIGSGVRNHDIVSDADRERLLVIDGGTRSISGNAVNEGGSDCRYSFVGTFWGSERVHLGHLSTDPAGRLVVVPPNGLSFSPSGSSITGISDNDGWCDDWSDGPVRATIAIGARAFEAETAWVACLGPDFAPEIPPITTLHDVISDLNVRQGWTREPPRPLSYMTYIYPIFQRTALTQWVAASGTKTTAWLDPNVDFTSPAFMEKLADPKSENIAFREHILSLFRNPRDMRNDAAMQLQAKLPYQIGDLPDAYDSPLQWFQFPKQQYGFLVSWANGEFIDDRSEYDRSSLRAIEDYPPAEQPALLTEAALAALSGGAFHPGVELSRHLGLAPLYKRHYSAEAEPFRVAYERREFFSQNLGPLLTADAMEKGYGVATPPVGPQMAGDLTRWMGVPWQVDAFSCQQVLLQENFPTATWWPAQYPTDVLTEEDYNLLMDSNADSKARQAAYDNRRSWWRDVPGVGIETTASPEAVMSGIISSWENMGFVVKKPSPKDRGAPSKLPSDVYVEVHHTENWGLEEEIKTSDSRSTD